MESDKNSTIQNYGFNILYLTFESDQIHKILLKTLEYVASEMESKNVWLTTIKISNTVFTILLEKEKDLSGEVGVGKLTCYTPSQWKCLR